MQWDKKITIIIRWTMHPNCRTCYSHKWIKIVWNGATFIAGSRIPKVDELSSTMRYLPTTKIKGVKFHGLFRLLLRLFKSCDFQHPLWFYILLLGIMNVYIFLSHVSCITITYEQVTSTNTYEHIRYILCNMQYFLYIISGLL